MDRLTAVHIKPSQITVYLHGAVWLLSLLALWLCGLLWWWKAVATVMLLAAALSWHRRQQQQTVAALGCEQAQWWVMVGDDKHLVELVGAQLVLPWLLVLKFRKQQTLVLWPDTASAEDLRRLRVYLRNG